MRASDASLAQRLAEVTGKPLADCERAADYMVIAWTVCREMRDSFAASRNEPTAKDQVRQLERLTRKNPRAEAVRNLSHQAAFHLEQALCRCGEWSEDWRNRHPRELARAARNALERLRASGTSAGRPPDYATTRFIATVAHIAETVLDIQPSGAPGAVFRRVMMACAEAFGIHAAEFNDAGISSGSRRIDDAVKAYRAGTLPFGLVFMLVSRSNIKKLA